MAITTSIEITTMAAKKSLDGKSNVIEFISFTVKATEGDYTRKVSGVQKLNFDPTSFIEWADTPEFKAQVIEWTKPYSDELLAICITEVTELAKGEDETLKFTI